MTSSRARFGLLLVLTLSSLCAVGVFGQTFRGGFERAGHADRLRGWRSHLVDAHAQGHRQQSHAARCAPHPLAGPKRNHDQRARLPTHSA